MRSSIIIKKFISLALSLALVISLCAAVTGCGSTQEQTSEYGITETAEDAGKVIEESDDMITIIDQAGRPVKVKKDIESVAYCYRVVARFLINLDKGDLIKGAGKSEEFLEMVQPSLKDAVDVGKGVADIEALAELKPDLFIHKASDIKTLDAVENIGIPALAINIETPEDMMKAIEILGKVCGAEDKANELISYYNDRLADLAQRTAGINKPATAIVMGSSIGKVADASMLQGIMLEKAGLVNSAAELEATELWPTAGTEQIFAWNPDYIFITGSESAVYTADDILNDKTWSELNAVKNGHVYTIPSELDSWEFPGVVSVLGMYYMLNKSNPDLMTDEELDKEVTEFYKLNYGREFDRDELKY